jgi:prepilin-type N-terminal cleavage/methylation domain-containing protein
MIRDESGFTLIELLVVLSLFSIVSVGFYQVMFSGARGSDVARSQVRVSAEARLGLNRMVRDTREATELQSATPNRYQVWVNFDGDANRDESPPDSTGYENLTFEFSGNKIYVTALGLPREILVDGVSCLAADCSANPVFTYTSGHLEWDWDADGVTTATEVDMACATRGVTGVGDCDGSLDPAEISWLSGVVYRFNVSDRERDGDFYTEAILRNRR